MTLWRLVLAWLPVAVLFLGVDWVTRQAAASPEADAPAVRPNYRLAVEAVLVTLFASLWFDSLGSGAWWLLFGVVGMIVAWQRPSLRSRAAVLDVVRYVAAGALLAWRLR